ncbi:hypothetical protein DET59_101208 [Rossellomorea aquimaris]|uniref:Uncharacterized protein n=1 Tax=Rossellomorea aquimaris TaxID=189382 RepID=A0A366F1H9_9BACI|nr:hypothetical protein DET59_101208 [Rossellomorea aquimaris]
MIIGINYPERADRTYGGQRFFYTVPIPIIREAMNIGDGLKVGLFNSEEERIKHTLGFAKYLISYCNDMFSPVNFNHT